jgi:aspartyl-tRNA(Asn)/glutamyl-tRNA(Gln) amidotransferase subunit B
MVNTGKDATAIIKEKNLSLMSNADELDTITTKVIEENPKAVEDYKKGKKSALAFLIGQTMKATKGKADPKTLSEVFNEKLNTSLE